MAFCKYCGSQLPEDSVFCSSCGKRVVCENEQEQGNDKSQQTEEQIRVLHQQIDQLRQENQQSKARDSLGIIILKIIGGLAAALILAFIIFNGLSNSF